VTAPWVAAYRPFDPHDDRPGGDPGDRLSQHDDGAHRHVGDQNAAGGRRKDRPLGPQFGAGAALGAGGCEVGVRRLCLGLDLVEPGLGVDSVREEIARASPFSLGAGGLGRSRGDLGVEGAGL
jgi:hypothetical protein